MIEITIPGKGHRQLHHLVLDVNGTIARGGYIIDGVADRLRLLSRQLTIHLLTADTYGKQNMIDEELGIRAQRIEEGNEAEEKARFVERLGAGSVVAVGNGANDVSMLDRAGLSIAVLGHEGLCVETLRRADVLVGHINHGLDLLLEPNRLVATLRE